MDVVDEKPVPLPVVAAILKGKEADYAAGNVEILYEQRRALDHALKYSKISEKDAEDMAEKLSALDPSLGAERVTKIIDLMPNSVDDIRAIFAKERFKYTEEEIRKFLDVVDQYR